MMTEFSFLGEVTERKRDPFQFATKSSPVSVESSVTRPFL